MPRTSAENLAVFKKKAPLLKSQSHFDMIMELFPVEERDAVYAQIQPLLRVPLVLNKDSADTMTRLHAERIKKSLEVTNG